MKPEYAHAERPAVVRLYLQADAPAKRAEGAACNGCGLCCAWQPCPLGMLVSRRRHGACRALQWQAAGARYRCGMLVAPEALWPWLPRWGQAAVRAMARRWISAGSGCDSSLEAAPAED